MKKTMIAVLGTACMTLCLMGTASIHAEAEDYAINATTVASYNVNDGASVRANEKKAETGIRWKVSRKESEYTALTSNVGENKAYTSVSFGLAIAYSSYLTPSHELTEENIFTNPIFKWEDQNGVMQGKTDSKAQIWNFTTSELKNDGKGNYYFQAAIIDMVEGQSLASNRTPQAYIAFTSVDAESGNEITDYYFAPQNKDAIRSMTYVAQQAIAANEKNSENLQAWYVEPTTDIVSTYTIEHYTELEDGSFILYDVEEVEATIDDSATLTANSYDGYVVADEYEDNLTESKVYPNNALTLKQYYYNDYLVKVDGDFAKMGNYYYVGAGVDEKYGASAKYLSYDELVEAGISDKNSAYKGNAVRFSWPKEGGTAASPGHGYIYMRSQISENEFKAKVAAGYTQMYMWIYVTANENKFRLTDGNGGALYSNADIVAAGLPQGSTSTTGAGKWIKITTSDDLGTTIFDKVFTGGTDYALRPVWTGSVDFEFYLGDYGFEKETRFYDGYAVKMIDDETGFGHPNNSTYNSQNITVEYKSYADMVEEGISSATSAYKGNAVRWGFQDNWASNRAAWNGNARITPAQFDQMVEDGYTKMYFWVYVRSNYSTMNITNGGVNGIIKDSYNSSIAQNQWVKMYSSYTMEQLKAKFYTINEDGTWSYNNVSIFRFLIGALPEGETDGTWDTYIGDIVFEKATA